MLSKAEWPRRSVSMSDDITHRASVTGAIEMLNRRSHGDRANAAIDIAHPRSLSMTTRM